jgi:type IV pilus assembly protein PilB
MKKIESFVEDFGKALAKQHALTLQDVKMLAQTYKDHNDLTFEEFLLSEGLVDKAALLQAMTDYYQVPAMDVQGVFFDHYLLSLFPKDVMLRLGFIPYKREGDVLTVIAANPNHPLLSGIINRYIVHDIEFRVGFLSHIRSAIQEFYDSSITPNPNSIQNQRMERSQIDVHESNQPDFRIPEDVQETIDDYESH